jgi:nitrogen fixation NifU-like protein
MYMPLSEDLYKDIIIEYSQNPEHFGEPPGCTIHEEGVNRSCGDEVTLHLLIEDGIIKKAGFTGQGCSISMASSEMLASSIEGKTIKEVRDLIDRFKGMILEGKDPQFSGDLEDLEALKGVVRYPIRVKCATLSWNTLEQAIERN